MRSMCINFSNFVLDSQMEDFTDGSKINNRSGLAFSIGASTCSYRHRNTTTNFMVELEAILLRLEESASRPNNQPTTYLTSTDSLLALTALSNTHVPHPIVSRNQTLLASLAHDIIFIWISSHKGIQGNETVDFLAIKATNLRRINPRFLPSKSDLSAFIHQKITDHWVTTWQQQPPLKQSPPN